jgi:antitoxin component YwqK of YwqJK toxin-antitoxin module
MKHLLFFVALLGLVSCNSSGGGGAAAPLEGYQTENVGGGVTKAFKKDASGNFSEVGFLVNGVKNGAWMTYYDGEEAGKIKTYASYSNGALNGPYYEYNNRGQIETEVNYANNQYDGIVSSYKFGRPTVTKTYKANELNGPSYDYFGDGKLQKETNFKDGKQHGIMTWYNEEGRKTMEYEYKNGTKISGGIVN